MTIKHLRKRARLITSIMSLFQGSNYDQVDLSIFEADELAALRQVVEEHLLAVRQFQRRLNDVTAKCVTCKEPFTPARSDARYCSPACRQRAYRDR
jgi:hypothetical protein